jgi:hypothetical protein
MSSKRILHEQLLVDSTSRDYPAWPELSSFPLGNDEAGPLLREEELLTGFDFTSSLLHHALATLEDYLRSETFAAEVRVFDAAHDRAVPDFYRTPDEFRKLVVESIPVPIDRTALELLIRISDALDESSQEVANYATFIFRGLFYQQLAHSLSISYVPHSWRSSAVNAEADHPSLDFTRYLSHIAQDLRRELARKLNSEFGQTAFSEDFPVLASYVVNQTKSRGELIHTAIDIRRNHKAQAFRQWTARIQTLIRDQRDLPEIARASEELRDVIGDLRKELGLPSNEKGQELTIKVGVPIVPVASAETSLTLGIPRAVRRIINRRTHLVFLRDVARKSTSLTPFVTAFHGLTA